MSAVQIPTTESLRVELKSDVRKLPDQELVLAAVCLANTEGGEIYLGVENDGRVSGLHPEHHDMMGLAALIANRTVPPLSVRTALLEVQGKSVARIDVPHSPRLVATANGTLQRRRLLADGTPQCVPFLPHEFSTRASDLRQIDYSSLPVAGATLEVLDPTERQRLRQAIERYGGDRLLLGLDDEELDGALGLTRREGLNRYPTVAGLLLIGREMALREHVPTHEVAFQVLDATEVRVNEFFRWPLIRLFEQIETLFSARVVEDEVQMGLFRVPVPNVDRRAFRETVVNALVHRDYTRLGAVHIRWQSELLTVSNPGGFVEGVTLGNLLVVEPRPRNPLLADTFKRLGLAERTGRGVDLIYQGLLRYGRPAPSYARSDATNVVVELSCTQAHLGFLKLVVEQERRHGGVMPIDSLLILDQLRRERRVEVTHAAAAIQKDVAVARGVLERLVEAGLAEAHGIKRGRTYTLSAQVYRELGESIGYVRQAGFDRLQQEQMVRRYVEQHGTIRRHEAMKLCGISRDQATRLLQSLVAQGVLVRHGERKGTFYERA